MIDSALLQKIQREAIHLDWDVAFGGRSKGNKHLFRVARIAEFLAQQENADVSLCVACAWIHDVGLIVGKDDSPDIIQQTAFEVLTNIGVESLLAKRISECVSAHEGDMVANDLEAKIVHDADVLDKSGILGVIRHTWKIVNMIDVEASDENIYATICQHLKYREQKLYTPTAKKIATILNLPLNKLISEPELGVLFVRQIADLSRRGMISDEIANVLVSEHQSIYAQELSEQLKCSYIK